MPTLTWIGKQAVEKHHLEIPYRLLEYDETLSVGDKESGNLLVQGDNLHALKALLPYYAGKVKCIYIDPPYNTGNEGWQYNDNVNAPEIRAWLNKVVGPEGEDLSRHDKWLCMMYPRLQLLKKFLCEDGLIFVSIDDNEQANLKLLMDEIYGSNNFIANILWQKIHSIKNDAKYLSVNHDFIVLYARNMSKVKINLLSRSSKMDARYKNPDNDPRGPWQSGDLVANEPRKDGNYDVNGPTGKVFNVPLDKHWVYSKLNLMKMIEENRIWFGKNGDSFPRKKRFLTEVQQGKTPDTWWLSDEAGHNQEAKREIKSLLQIDNQTFATPKPIRLIKRVLQISTEEDSIILDSFAGSGTTGHAVAELNKEDGGNRKFILVEIEEKIAKEVTAERINRVINGYSLQKPNGRTEQVSGLGGGFRYCKLGDPLFNRFGNIRQSVKFKELARHIFFSETGVPLLEKAKLNTSLIGTYKGTAYYLLFNGILGDKSVNGGNVLTSKILESFPKHNGPKIVFGESNRLSLARLKKENIIFKQIPYEIKTS